jgi:hypothetical protein
MTEPAVSLLLCGAVHVPPARVESLDQTFTPVAVVFLESSFVFPSSSSRRLLLVRWVSAVTSRRRNDGPWCTGTSIQVLLRKQH